jgi:hypothetical protein
MLVLREVAANDLDVRGVEIGDRGERAAEAALTVPAVADRSEDRMPPHAIAYGAADATAFMHVVHFILPEVARDGRLRRAYLDRQARIRAPLRPGPIIEPRQLIAQ